MLRAGARRLIAKAAETEVAECSSPTWMAQELLTTFEEEIAELTLKPGTGGIFEIRANGALIWSRKEKERFPEIKELKQLV